MCYKSTLQSFYLPLEHGQDLYDLSHWVVPDSYLLSVFWQTGYRKDENEEKNSTYLLFNCYTAPPYQEKHNKAWQRKRTLEL